MFDMELKSVDICTRTSLFFSDFTGNHLVDKMSFNQNIVFHLFFLLSMVQLCFSFTNFKLQQGEAANSIYIWSEISSDKIEEKIAEIKGAIKFLC